MADSLDIPQDVLDKLDLPDDKKKDQPAFLGLQATQITEEIPNDVLATLDPPNDNPSDNPPADLPREMGVGEKALKTVFWGLRPLLALQGAVAAPIGHNYTEDEFKKPLPDWLLHHSPLAVAGKAFIEDMFPVWGADRPNYEGDILDKFAPDMPDRYRLGAELAISFLTDPLFILSVGFAKPLKAALKDAAHTKHGPWMHAVLEFLSYVPLRDPAEAMRAKGLAVWADEGDKSAAQKIVDIFTDPDEVAKAADKVDVFKKTDDLAGAVKIDPLNEVLVQAVARSKEPTTEVLAHITKGIKDADERIVKQVAALAKEDKESLDFQLEAYKKTQGVFRKLKKAASGDALAKAILKVESDPINVHIAQAIEDGGFSISEVVELVGEKEAKQLNKTHAGLMKKDGKSVKEFAASKNYDDPQSMIKAFNEKKSLKAQTDAEVRSLIEVERMGWNSPDVVLQEQMVALRASKAKKEADSALKALKVAQKKAGAKQTTKQTIVDPNKLIQKLKEVKGIVTRAMIKDAETIKEVKHLLIGSKKANEIDILVADAKAALTRAQQIAVQDAKEAAKLAKLDIKGKTADEVAKLKAKHAKQIYDLKQKALVNQAKIQAQMEILKEADRVKRMMARINARIKKAANHKTLPDEWKEQMQDVFREFGIRLKAKNVVPVSDKKLSFEDFMKSKQDSGEVIGELVDLRKAISELDTRTFSELTLDQRRLIDDFVTTMVHQGIREKKFLGEQKNMLFEDVVNGLVSGMNKLTKKFTSMTPNQVLEQKKRQGWIAKLGRLQRSIYAALYKIDFVLFDLDGFKHQGPVWRQIMRPLNKAELAETKLLESTFKKYGEIFEKFTAGGKGKAWANKTIAHQLADGTTVSITKEQTMMIALNSGNKENRLAVVKGQSVIGEDGKLVETITDADIDTIVASLSKEELKAVDEVWDLFNGFWDRVANVHWELHGKRLKKVEGKYFPIKYDRDLEFFVKKKIFHETELGNLFADVSPNIGRARTEASSRKLRVGSKGELVDLDFNVVSRHLQNVIHDITHTIAVRDIQKIILNDDFRLAVSRRMGSEIYDVMIPWLRHVARPTREAYDLVEKFWGIVRRNTTAAILGLKVSVALKQTLSFTQTIDELRHFEGGVAAVFEAGAQFISNPWQSWKMVTEMSETMKFRGQRFDRELLQFAERFNPKIGPLSNAARDAFFGMIRVMDKFAVAPTWMASYKIGLRKHAGNTELAVEFADAVVARTQPVAGAKDLAEIQRGSEFRHLMMMFYTFFSGFQNRMMQQGRKIVTGNSSVADSFAAYFLMLVAPAIMAESINKRRLPTDLTARETVGAIGMMYTGGIPLIRDIGLAVGTDYEFSFSPAQQSIASVIRAVKKRDAEALIGAAGLTLGIPTRQAFITAEGIGRWDRGATHGMDAVIEAILGKPVKKK